MRSRETLAIVILAACLLADTVAGQATRPKPRLVTDDQACQATTLVSTGGAAPRSPNTLAIRWTGFSNFELVYKGQVLLLDAFFDRGSLYPPLGFRAADIKRADGILIGHAHFDHMSDAASVALRTGAPVVGAAITTDMMTAQSVPAAQIRTVTGKGGEVLRFGPFSVEPILGRHGEPPIDVMQAFQTALNATHPKRTAAETAEQAALRQKNSTSAVLTSEGTITYVITLDTGFRLVYRDSAGVVTDLERAAMARIGSVDVALVAIAPSYVNALVTGQALDYVHTYKPSVFMPAHHDATRDQLWRPTEPIFQALKDANPLLVTVSNGYREPVCFDVRVTTPRAVTK